MIARLLARLVRFMPGRRIDGDEGEPYLERYYVLGLFGWHVYLHRFVDSDPDRGVHDHPWRHAVSLVLSGGYREVRLTDRDAGETEIRCVRAPALNVIRGRDFHRILLDGGEAWTLFLHGPRVKGWGFLRHGRYQPHARDASDFRHDQWWALIRRGELWVDRPVQRRAGKREDQSH